VVGNLVGAELWRASSLVHAARVLGRDLVVTRTIVNIERVVTQVLENFLPERRLRNLQMEAAVSLPSNIVVLGDERLLMGAVSSAILATIALVEAVPGARIVVGAAAPRSMQIALTVTQQSVMPPAGWLAHAYDEAWTERPGGDSVLLALLSMRETAALLGGHAALSNAEPGTTISITVPTGPSS
jgi:hypothetical protein